MLTEIPPVIVGALIAGCVTTVVAVVGLVFNAWSQRKAREFELRRAAVLEAVAHMADTLDYFGLAANMRASDEDLAAALRPFAGAMFKVHVVAGMETISALADANRTLMAAVKVLAERRAAVQQAVDTGDQGEMVNALRALGHEAAARSLAFQRALREANVRVRRELKIPLPEAEYRAAMDAIDRQIAAEFARAMAGGDQS